AHGIPTGQAKPEQVSVQSCVVAMTTCRRFVGLTNKLANALCPIIQKMPRPLKQPIQFRPCLLTMGPASPTSLPAVRRVDSWSWLSPARKRRAALVPVMVLIFPSLITPLALLYGWFRNSYVKYVQP